MTWNRQRCLAFRGLCIEAYLYQLTFWGLCDEQLIFYQEVLKWRPLVSLGQAQAQQWWWRLTTTAKACMLRPFGRCPAPLTPPWWCRPKKLWQPGLPPLLLPPTSTPTESPLKGRVWMWSLCSPWKAVLGCGVWTAVWTIGLKLVLRWEVLASGWKVLLRFGGFNCSRF